MKLNILAIVSPPIVTFMEETVPALRAYCDVTVLEACSNPDARTLFEAHGHGYDAVVFSGRIFMVYATRNRYDTGIPCFAFDDLAADVTTTLYRILIRDRDFDFSRASVDMLITSGDPMGIRRIFPPDQPPYCLEEDFNPLFTFDDVSTERLTQKVLAWHLELYRTGKIRHVITRFGAITRELAEAGVPFTYMEPSREYIINFFMQIVSSLTMQYAEDQILAVIALRCICTDSDASERLLEQCATAIATHGRLAGYDFSFALTAGRLEIITRHKVLVEITEDFSAVPFLDLAPESALEQIYMGMGTGSTLFQARLNASSALSASGTASKVFYVSHRGQVTGPLGVSHEEFRALPDDRLIDLSAQYGVDHVVLQQLLAYTKIAGRNVMTAQELAQFMDVSRRTANRILTKITESGGARIYAENSSGGKGRPKIQYQLLFN